MTRDESYFNRDPTETVGMPGRLWEGLLNRRPGKPREIGITMVLDKLDGPTGCLGLEERSPYVDYVKLGWGLPLLVDEEVLRERISLYHQFDLDVGFGGTLFELSYVRGRAREFLERAWEVGFNVAEVSSGIIDVPLEERLELADHAREQGFKVTFEVGKKDPTRRLSLREVTAEIDAAFRGGSVWKVVIEGREFGRASCIFDESGNILSHRLSAIASTFDHSKIIFEAPRTGQQIELIRRLGPDVNLGNIGWGDVLSLESIRVGVRGDTFLIKSKREPGDLSPSERFVLFVIKEFGPMSTSELKRRTGLPPRTIYSALKSLRGKGLLERTSGARSPMWVLA